MYCKHCGKEISETAKFCDECGKPIANEIVRTIPIFEETPKKNKKKRGPIGCLVWAAIVLVVFGSCSAAILGNNSGPDHPEISKEEYISLCKQINYEDLARNPDSHDNEYFMFTGEVVQVMEQGNYVNLRVNVTPETILNTTYYKDTIYVVAELDESGDRILINDIITLYGVCRGLHTYTTVLGSEVSIPRIDAGYWEIVK